MVDNLIDVKDAPIFWNDEGAGRVTEIVVVERKQHLIDAGHYGRNGPYQRYLMSDGCWRCDWPQPGKPEALFGQLLAHGTDPALAEILVREFAKIRQCEWARHMLKAIQRERGDGDDGQ